MANKAHKWVGYAGYMHIDGASLAKASKEFGDVENQLELIEELVSEGYTFTISPKSLPDDFAYVCKLTGSYTAVNRGLTLSSFAGSVNTAVSLTLYKHLEMCNGSTWPVGKSNSYG